MATGKFLDKDGLAYYDSHVKARDAQKTELPTKLTDLNNDGNFVQDAAYKHTDNNYTDAEKTKLAGIETNADANVLEAITVNGVAAQITNKTVNITVPTDNKNLTNGAGYQTAANVKSTVEGYGYQNAANVKATVESYGYQTSDQVEAAITDKGYQTAQQVETAITGKGYQTAEQVESAIAAKGYQTAGQVASAIEDYGYQTASDVTSAIESYEYQTAPQVESIVTGKGYQTASQVDSAIAAKGYQTADQVNAIVTGKGYQTASNVKSTVEGYGYQTSAQVESAITAKGYQTESQVNNIVNAAVANAAHLKRTIVDELPTTGEENTIYLVPSASSKDSNVKDEYMWINSAWEKIGSSEVDLTGYLKESDLTVITTAEIDAMFA